MLQKARPGIIVLASLKGSTYLKRTPIDAHSSLSALPLDEPFCSILRECFHVMPARLAELSTARHTLLDYVEDLSRRAR